MLPKIEACLDFVEKTNGKAIITSLEKASEGIKAVKNKANFDNFIAGS